MRCAEKIPWDSQMLATNAAWLHRACFPDCAGVEVYKCRSGAGHWHFGHATRAASEACQAVKLPPAWRPSRVHRRGRRYRRPGLKAAS